LPSPLLLPRDCLLLGTLRWLLLPDLLLLRTLLLSLLDLLLLLRLLSLLDPLLLLRLLGLLDPLLLLRLLGLLDPLLLLRLLSRLDPLLLLRGLRLPLRALLLCGWWSTSLLLSLLLFRLGLVLALLVLLRCGDNRPEKQKQGRGTGSCNESHGNRPPSKSLLGVHADGQSVSTMFQRLCCLRLSLRLVHRPSRVIGRRVKRIQLQRRRLRRIDHVMVGACRNHDRISVSRPALLRLVEDEFGLTLFDPEELVDVRVNLVSDIFPRSQAHHDKLGVLSGE
jgi:hypothetical protein